LTVPTLLAPSQSEIKTLQKPDSTQNFPLHTPCPQTSLSLPLPSSLTPDPFPQFVPGYSQSKDSEHELLAVLNPTSPSSLHPGSITQLSIYRGKEVISSASNAGPSTSIQKEAKSFAWSRGIATELSPLQTRSSRKNKEKQNTQQAASDLPILDGKALRAMKALALSN
jgi:hypothetical protein